jgi:hypothetical protein
VKRLLLSLLGLDCQIQAEDHGINAISPCQPPDLAIRRERLSSNVKREDAFPHLHHVSRGYFGWLPLSPEVAFSSHLRFHEFYLGTRQRVAALSECDDHRFQE